MDGTKEKALRDAVLGLREWAEDLLARLVAVPTVNPPGREYPRLVSVLGAAMEELGLGLQVFFPTEAEVRRLYPESEGLTRPNLVGRLRLGRTKTLHLNGHYDVVPPGEGWTRDPFVLGRDGEWLRGRGAGDMKGTIVAHLAAVAALRKIGLEPSCDLEFGYVPDEESGGDCGLGWLIRRDVLKADAGLFEGHSGPALTIANKGVLWLEIVVRGRSGHASRPYEGVNAFDGIVAVARGLLDALPQLCAARSDLPVARPEDARGVMTLGGIISSATAKVNVIPGKVSFTVDRRLLPEEDPARAQAEIEARAREALPVVEGMTLEVRRLQFAPAVVCPEDSEIVRALAASIEHVYGKKPPLRLSAFFTDMRFMAKIPCCGHSVRSQNIHGPDEGVHREDLLDTALTLALLCTTFGA
ncbi:MAG TPA: ArgE/DapE family deacylase [bacterium]|nr:ArgE/DapE family deacylase [bacterium]